MRPLVLGLILVLAGCVTAPGYDAAARAAVENCARTLPPGAHATFVPFSALNGPNNIPTTGAVVITPNTRENAQTLATCLGTTITRPDGSVVRP